MKRVKSILQVVIGVALLAALVIGLSGLLSSLNREPTGLTSITGGPAAPGTDTTRAAIVYPPPWATEPAEVEPEVELTPTEVPLTPFPESPPLLGGRAATLHNEDLWLVESAREPVALTQSSDISAMFGWNRDGTLLLFGRGRVSQAEYLGDTTDLWVISLDTKETIQLTTGAMVQTAGWSPVDDRIAYCELGNVLKVMDLAGEILQQVEPVICDFTWAPDGSGIAAPTFTPDMVAADGLKASTLAIWWLEENILQNFSDAKGEGHGWPIWSLDGQRIFFQRTYFLEQDKQALSGAHVLDIASGEIRRLESANPGAQAFSRSPRADRVVYRIGTDIFVTDFEGNIQLLGQGRSPTWLTDGRTLLYRAVDDSYLTVIADTPLSDSSVGGDRPAPGLYLQPEYFVDTGG